MNEFANTLLADLLPKGPSYRVEKNLFSENQKSKLGFDWSECQHATHGDFDISEILFSAKMSWGTFS